MHFIVAISSGRTVLEVVGRVVPSPFSENFALGGDTAHYVIRPELTCSWISAVEERGGADHDLHSDAAIADNGNMYGRSCCC